MLLPFLKTRKNKMFVIKERHKPVFNLSDIKNLCQIVEIVFSFEKIDLKNLEDFNLATSARINEINGKIFVAKDKDYKLDLSNYEDYLTKMNFMDKFVEASSKITNSHLKVYKASDLNNSLDHEIDASSVIIDFDDHHADTSHIKSGDYLCTFKKSSLPKNQFCCVGFSADISIETELNRFDKINIDFERAIGLVKI